MMELEVNYRCIHKDRIDTSITQLQYIELTLIDV